MYIAKLSLILVAAIISQVARADTPPSPPHCADLTTTEDQIKALNGRLTQLTQDQWQFLRGIYAMSPDTPPGLPYGDKAMLVQIDGNESGLILFVDENKVCTPMRAPPALLTLIREVAAGSVNHDGPDL